MLRQLLKLNPDLNACDKMGRTAIHFACRSGKKDAVKVLAEQDDCDIDAVTNSGVTPLMMAVETGDISFVAICLNCKLNPFLKDALDRTAVNYAEYYRS